MLAERGLALRTDALGSAHPDVARDSQLARRPYHAAGRYVDAGHSYHCALAALEISTVLSTSRWPSLTGTWPRCTPTRDFS